MEGLKMKYFVLKPEAKAYNDIYAEASRRAMKTYSNHIRQENEVLAKELRSWADEESVKSMNFLAPKTNKYNKSVQQTRGKPGR